MKKIIIWILFVALVVGGAIYLFRSNQNAQQTRQEEVSTYFYDKMIELAIADIGMAIEGFDPNLLMMAYPGLRPSDFAGVEAFEGAYEVRGEEVIFRRNTEEPISSAERTVSEEGYQTLLTNLSSRLSVSRESKEDIDNLIEKINTADRIETKIGQGASAYGLKITPTEIMEDSRCPIDVTCIQAGTVRVRASIETPVAHGSKIFDLDKPVLVDKWEVVLVQVDPVPESGVERADGDYTFFFRISTVTN